jgi:hypothetical protein
LLLPEWEKIVLKQNLKMRIMPRDVSTHWNSTFNMLAFAVKYKDAICTITSHIDCNLLDCQLTKEEWGHADELAKVLEVCSRFFIYYISLMICTVQIFKDGMLLFSQDNTTVSSVIPVMDAIDEVLTVDPIMPAYSAPVQAALKLGKCTLNRYYSKTNKSEVYRTAMGKTVDLTIPS